MLLLVLGLALWIGAHLSGRFAPDLREKLGRKGVSAAIVVGLIAMVIGYRMAPFINVWFPPAGLTHVNNLLMIIAIFIFGMSHAPGLKGVMRHPQLIAVKIWAIAHLMVNGDLASIILFGSLLAWAVVSVIKINKAGEWARPDARPRPRDWIINGALALVLTAVIIGVHAWAGVSPVGGGA